MPFQRVFMCGMKRNNKSNSAIPALPQKPLSFFWYVSGQARLWALGAIVVVVIATVGSQLTTFFFKFIVDAVEQGNKEAALIYGLLFPVAMVVIQLFYRLSGFLGMNWAVRTREFGYNTMSDYLVQHSNSFFGERFAGSILSKLRNVVEGIDATIPEFLWTHLAAFVGFVTSFFIILSVDATSALLFILLLILLIGINALFTRKKTVLAKENAEASSLLSARTADLLTNIQAARQYVRLKDEMSALHALSGRKARAYRASWLFTEKLLLINSLMIFFVSFLMLFVLINRWQVNAISTGDVVLVIAVISQISFTMLFIGRAINSTARMMGEIEEGLEDLVVSYDVVDVPGAKQLRARNGMIEWKSVNFQFEKGSVFDNLTLTIPPGQRLGLVGQSGAGKTTFLSLLLRQHDIAGGEILIDGQNIAKVTQSSLRSHIAVVPQEPLLFHRTIRENIAYGNPDATDKEIVAVAQKAQAHQFITATVQGYDTLVGERGVKLSGGQKQRIAIARAMLKGAPILVLDEATSALDSESEGAIQEALQELMKDRTVVAIAHRLSTLRTMDRIIVLQEGRIIEDGTHLTLLHHKGTYARLWEHQAGGFVGG